MKRVLFFQLFLGAVFIAFYISFLAADLRRGNRRLALFERLFKFAMEVSKRSVAEDADDVLRSSLGGQVTTDGVSVRQVFAGFSPPANVFRQQLGI